MEKYEEMSKEELIQVIKALQIIRSNYEKQFGVIMYANGDMVKSKSEEDIDYTHLLMDKGIKPEKINPEDVYCSIGFCEKEQKWYGWNWTGRVWGFGIGFIVRRGMAISRRPDIDEFENPYLLPDGFIAKTLDDCKRMAIAFATLGHIQ